MKHLLLLVAQKTEKTVPVGVLWHEAIRGRSAEDVASAFIAFLRTLEDLEDAIL